jgi:predicted nucleic acid-binding Zn ribbon protein
MQRAGEFLGKVVRRLERPEAVLAWLTAAWPSIVGKALAAHTKPVRCAAGRLEVTIDSKAWGKQLAEMTFEFCGRINQSYGSNLVREVKFTVSKTDTKRVPHELDNEYTPFVRQKKRNAD